MTEQQPVAVLGGGSFGTAVANLLAENGVPVRQWMRDPEQAEAMRVNRENPRYLKGIRLHDGVEPVSDLLATLQASELIFVALPSSALRSVLAPHAELLRGKGLVSLTKGIEAQSFKLMSQILEEIAPEARIGVLSGPNLAREIAEHALTATVVASEDEKLCQQVQAVLHGRTFRVYASADRFGVELGGALKNVYAIIAGMAVALGMGENTKSMLITRALAEMTRFAVSQGAVQGDSGFLLWELGFVRASGQPMHICGTSYLEFDAQGLVAVHRDFWDPVEEIFAKVPVLGAVARALQNKLRAPQ